MSDLPVTPPPPLAVTTADAPTPDRRGWQSALAPHFIGLFLWVVYFDQLGRRALPLGGLGWSAVGALAGGLLCAWMLYLAPALWGWRTGKSGVELAASTFGAGGAKFFLIPALGLAQVVWIAVATYYAVALSFQGFAACGLLDPKWIRPMMVSGVRLESPLILLTLLTWSFAAAVVGHYLIRVIAALMLIFPIFPASLLGLAMVLTLTGVRDFRPPHIDPTTMEPARDGPIRAVALMIQFIVGFFATAGLGSADWGAAVRTRRDVWLGGLVGVAGSAAVVAVLALLTIAGANGRYPAPRGLTPATASSVYTYQVAVLLGVGGTLAGVIFLVFGLASLAPTCYSANSLGHRFEAAWPRLSRLRWTLLGTAAAYPLMATGLATRLEVIVTILGAVFAPVAGAMAADYLRSRGEWTGPRPGFHSAGLFAWLLGLIVGLIPLLATLPGASDLARFQPAAVFAFGTGFVVNVLLVALERQPQKHKDTKEDTKGKDVGIG